MAVSGSCMEKGAMMREIAAGKNLITAYNLYAAENNGQLLPGIDLTASQVNNTAGKKLNPAYAGQRYPFRLAPYFNNKLEGTILVNDNAAQIEKLAPRNSSMYDYMVSAFPALGINYYLVGGCNTSGGVVWPDECTARLAQSDNSLLVFASGGTRDGQGNGVNGYNILTPPFLLQPMWSGAAWNKNTEPGNYGNVDARYSGRAVCVFLDGSTRLKTIDELRDMRLWSRNAAAQNNPSYMISQ